MSMVAGPVWGARFLYLREKQMNQGIEHKRTPVNAWMEGKREPFDEEKQRRLHPDFLEEGFWEICRDVWDYTCLSMPALYNFYTACVYAVEEGIEGDIVECGVYFGGSIMLAMHTMERLGALGDRRVVAVDTFNGFVRRTDHDVDFQGKEVCHPSKRVRDFYEQTNANIRSVPCDQSCVDVVRGDVLKVLWETVRDRKIAVLRLDTDTYDTTRHGLEVAWDRVSSGGVVIIDDYGWCLGARKATDDFIRGRKAYLNRVNPWTRSIVKL